MHDERTVILAVSVKLPKHQLRMRTTNPSDCVSGLVQPRIVAAGRNGLRDTVLSSREAQPKAQSGATTSEWGGMVQNAAYGVFSNSVDQYSSTNQVERILDCSVSSIKTTLKQGHDIAFQF